MKVFLGTDHAGYWLKGHVASFLQSKGYEVVDCGAHAYNADDDYPDFVHAVAQQVIRDPDCRGIVLGGSGQGEAIVANRYSGIRAIVCYGPSHPDSEEPMNPTLPMLITLSREHNDANILSLGARFLKKEHALELVELWLTTSFSGAERHERRIGKIDIHT